MAINKVSATSKSHGAMRNVIQYVLQDKKSKGRICRNNRPL